MTSSVTVKYLKVSIAHCVCERQLTVWVDLMWLSPSAPPSHTKKYFTVAFHRGPPRPNASGLRFFFLLLALLQERRRFKLLFLLGRRLAW